MCNSSKIKADVILPKKNPDTHKTSKPVTEPLPKSVPGATPQPMPKPQPNKPKGRELLTD